MINEIVLPPPAFPRVNRFLNFFKTRESHIKDKKLLDHTLEEIEKFVENTMRALFVYSSGSPEETLQFHLEEQRLFKAECYLKILDALNASME